ncbi:MAG: ankyrin repeat domain-containing protein, partial [Acidiferrobacterales bacterium]
MSAKLLARSFHLTIVLIVTMAIGGCVVPVQFYHGPKPSAMTAGKATKAAFLKKTKEAPIAETFDGRFFLSAYDRETVLLAFLIFDATAIPLSHEYGRLLIEFDSNDVVKRHLVHKCESETTGAICGAPDEAALWKMIKELLGEEPAAAYRQAMVRAAPLAAPLYGAVRRGDLEEVKRLIAKGAFVPTSDIKKATPLELAVSLGHTAMAEWFITQGGTNVQAKDNHGDTLLHLAAINGHAEMAAMLLTHGAKVGAINNIGDTPLHEAAREGYSAIAKFLLANGARVDVRNEDGATPLTEAALYGPPLTEAAINGRAQVVELLLAAGADVNAKDKKRRTPLHWAAER